MHGLCHYEAVSHAPREWVGARAGLELSVLARGTVRGGGPEL